MNRPELESIISEELAGRPLFAPPNVTAALDLYYRDLKALPASEVRQAIRDFYAQPVCQKCATRAGRWPHVEEIRAQIPQAVVDRAAKRRGNFCGLCDEGWVVQHNHMQEEVGVVPCECRRVA
jgi:hypothetical protein